MSVLEKAYNLSVNLLRPLLPAFGAASAKVSAAVEGRRAAAGAIRRWAEVGRDPFRPLLWLHGASAGELAGAIPVVNELRAAQPDVQLMVTYSSPSAESVLPELTPDYAGYPPLETMSDCREAIGAARPDAIVFAKLDAWPTLTRAAAEANVPLGMINATVRPGSSRLRGPGRQLLEPSYERLAGVGAVAVGEVERLQSLGTRAGAIRVTGDASFERALERIDRARGTIAGGGTRLARLGDTDVRVCAGSTWPEDERALVEAWAKLLSARGAGEESRPGGRLELVLVPHEPDAGAIRRIRDLCGRLLGVEPRIWSDLGQSPAEITAADPSRPLVVDAVGFLAELYLECDLAWVGGGVGGEGLHSVVEPAAAGLPVLFGPVHDRWEARDMVRRGVALEVPPDRIDRVLSELIAAPDRRAAMGVAARRYVEEGRGAAKASARLVLDLLASPAS